MYLAPFLGAAAIPQAKWIPLGNGGSQIWSPDGNRIFFASLRDGYRCIYQVPLDPINKHPLAEPKPVIHFHGRESIANLPPGSFRMSATYSGLVYSLGRREDYVVFVR